MPLRCLQCENSRGHTDRQTDRQTDGPSTVTLAAHARRGLIIECPLSEVPLTWFIMWNLYLILNEVDECVDVRVSVVGIVISNISVYAIFD